MLFLPEGQSLHGTIAIGPMSHQEAEQTWERLANRDFGSLLEEVVEFSRALRLGGEDNALGKYLNAHPLDIEKAGALADCLHSGKMMAVASGTNDRLRIELSAAALDHAFACLPLLGKNEKTIGVLLVDGRFLHSQDQIEPAMISIAETFVQFMTIYIENETFRNEAKQKKEKELWVAGASAAAHDLKNRIEAAGVYASFLKLKLENIEHEEAFRKLAASLETAKATARELSSLPHTRKTTAKPTQVAPLIRQACKVAQHKGVEVQILEDGTLPLAMIDAEDTARCFEELVANSLYWMRTGEKRLVVSFCIPGDEQSPKGDGEEVRFLRVIFEDSGVGVPAENKDKIFQNLFTTRGTHGLGSGLYRIGMLLGVIGGRVRETGEPGKGARFEMDLPIAKTEQGGVQRGQAAAG
jgi:signal transduction histidine kinase